MNITFDISYHLKFHHMATWFPYMEPRITICVDNLFNNRSVDILLDTDLAITNKKYSNENRGTYLMEFRGETEKVSLDDIKIVKSFYTKNTNEIPTNSCLMLFVFATHLNADTIPCQICVARNRLNIYHIWKSSSKKSFQTQVNMGAQDPVTNKYCDIGYLTLNFRPRSISISLTLKWKEVKDYTNEEIYKIAEKHRNEESKWMKKKFKIVWKGSESIVDMFGFFLNTLTIPSAFFLQRNRDLTEGEFMILLYFAIRRYCVLNTEKKIRNVWYNFNKLLSLEDKCVILNTMLTLPATSHSYTLDHIIQNDGEELTTEIFQDGSKSDTSDCEDSGNENVSYSETFNDLKNVKNPILLELQLINRMYINVIPLWRTTSNHVLVVPDKINSLIYSNNKRQFNSLIQKRIFESDGDNENVSAHMNGASMPKDEYMKRLVNWDTKEAKRIIQCELQESRNLENEYRKRFNENFSLKDLPESIREGTGEFNPVNQSDKHIKTRTQLLDEAPCLIHTKREIYHPLGDPYQFYLNIIEMITPYFIKKYGYGISTFVPSYTDEMSYGITYSDFVRKDDSYKLMNRKVLSREEMNVIYNTSRMRIRPAFNKVKNNMGGDLSEYENILNDPDKVLSIYDFSDIKIIGTPNKNDQEIIDSIVKIADEIVKAFKKHRGQQFYFDIKKSEIATMTFGHKFHLLFIKQYVEEFITYLCSSKMKIVSVEYFMEVFGENMRNVVFVISIVK